jgi:hypothetical protein
MTSRHPDSNLIVPEHNPKHHSTRAAGRDPVAVSALADLDSERADRWLASLTAEFAAGAAALDQGPHFPHDNLARLRRAGLLSLTVPRALGGHEATLAQTLKVVRAVARGEPSTALILVMQCLYHLRLQANANWPVALKQQIARDAVERGALISIRCGSSLNWARPRAAACPQRSASAQAITGFWMAARSIRRAAPDSRGSLCGDTPTSRSRASAHGSCIATHPAFASASHGIISACAQRAVTK